MIKATSFTRHCINLPAGADPWLHFAPKTAFIPGAGAQASKIFSIQIDSDIHY
jgi:hypothetical protein